MSDCLQNVIGVFGVCEEPQSGLFINNLPGINLSMLESIADYDNNSFEDVWNAVQSRAISMLIKDARIEIQKKAKIRRFESNTVGEYVEPNELKGSTAGRFQGLFIDADQDPNISLVLNFARLWLNADANFDLLIIDADTGTVLETISIEGNAGLNHIPLDLRYSTFGGVRKLLVAYNTDQVVNYRETRRGTSFDSCDCNCSAYYSRAKGFYSSNASTPTEANITEEVSTFGLFLSYGIKCKIENIICNNIDLFSRALWYVCGAELIKEQRFSDQTNRYTLVPTEDLENLYNSFLDDYMDDLVSVVEQLEFNDSYCFICDEPVKYIEDLP